LADRDIAETGAAALGVPAQAMEPDEAAAHFGWMNSSTAADMTA
jgi:hypothetical protein